VGEAILRLYVLRYGRVSPGIVLYDAGDVPQLPHHQPVEAPVGGVQIEQPDPPTCRGGSDLEHDDEAGPGAQATSMGHRVGYGNRRDGDLEP